MIDASIALSLVCNETAIQGKNPGMATTISNQLLNLNKEGKKYNLLWKFMD